jgi:hypothetical protein
MDDKKLTDTFKSIDPLLNAIFHVVGYQLPRDKHLSFNQLQFLNLKRSNSGLGHLSKEGAAKDWYPHFEKTVREVRVGLTACYYHVESVAKLETALLETVRSYLPSLNLKLGQGLAGGHYERLAFEYHAHIMTLRRALDYFAGSVGCYFKRDVTSIRGLKKKISDSQPSSVRDRISARIDRLATAIPDTFASREHAKSKRDLLAHYRNIDVGTLNISRSTDDRYFVGLAGGGEALSGGELPSIALEVGRGSDLPLTLAPKLQAQVDEVAQAILGSYWDMGLLEFPKHGKVSTNSKYAEI